MKPLPIVNLLFICFLLFLTPIYVQAQNEIPPLANTKLILEKKLQENIGKVVYVDFWASWCGPCRKSFPWMNEIQEKYKHQGFNVVSINLDSNKALADKFLVETPANFSVIYDPKGAIAKHFKIQGMPSSMIIGRDGKIKSRHTGFFPNKKTTYQQEIERLLNNEELDK